MHARPQSKSKSGLAILRAKCEVKDKSAGDWASRQGSESRFQRWRFRILRILGRSPRLKMSAAPLALAISNEVFLLFRSL